MWDFLLSSQYKTKQLVIPRGFLITWQLIDRWKTSIKETSSLQIVKKCTCNCCCVHPCNPATSTCSPVFSSQDNLDDLARADYCQRLNLCQICFGCVWIQEDYSLDLLLLLVWICIEYVADFCDRGYTRGYVSEAILAFSRILVCSEIYWYIAVLSEP